MSNDQVTALAGSITGGGWVASGLGAGGSLAALDATMKPIEALSSAGLGFLTGHVQPLQQVLDRMAGKSSVIHSFATAWQQVSTQVNQIQQQLAKAAAKDTAQWHGAAGDKYRAHAAQTTSALSQIAALAKAASSATTMAGQAVAGGRQQVNDLLMKLVQQLIPMALAAMATQGGATSTVLAQATKMISSYTSPISTIEQQVRQTLSSVQPQLTALANAMNSASTTTAATAAPPASTLLAQNQPLAGPPWQFGYESPGNNTTITLPGGKTIPVKPGGEYIIPRGSVVTQDGVQILNNRDSPNGFVMKDGTKVLAVDPDKVPGN
jgi:uncharacterized protein YukE